VREVARAGNVVIVGRGGAHILRDRPDVLHVFLHADRGLRERIVMQREKLDQAAAARRIHQMDANRRAYNKQVYGCDWLDVRLYDLAIDTGRMGFEGAAGIVVAALGAPCRRPGLTPTSAAAIPSGADRHPRSSAFNTFQMAGLMA